MERCEMPKKNSEFINRLRTILGRMSGAELARRLGVSDSRIPEWNAGRRLPSPDTLIKLGKFALELKLDDPFFFWALAGVDTHTLRLMADETVKWEYGIAGSTVPIRRFEETETGRVEVGPPVSLPAEFIPNPVETICVLVSGEPSAGQPLSIVREAPRGLFILDTSVEGTEDLRPLWGKVVMLHYTAEPHDLYYPGVYAGRLVLLDEPFIHHTPELAGTSGLLATLTEKAGLEMMFLGAYREPEGMKGIPLEDKDRRIQRMHEIHERALLQFRLREGIRILGKVIGRLTGHLERMPSGE
jgi:transcriptional regulator with XRE-family HTH domain